MAEYKLAENLGLPETPKTDIIKYREPYLDLFQLFIAIRRLAAYVTGGDVVLEAPKDGKTYGRKDGAWVDTGGGGGGGGGGCAVSLVKLETITTPTSSVTFTFPALAAGDHLFFKMCYVTTIIGSPSLRVYINGDTAGTSYVSAIDSATTSSGEIVNVGINWSGQTQLEGTITPTPNLVISTAEVPMGRNSSIGTWFRSQGQSYCVSKNVTTPVTSVTIASSVDFTAGSWIALYKFKGSP